MKKINVKLGSRSYDILVGRGAAGKIPSILKKMGFSGPVVIITDKVVEDKVLRGVKSVLKKIQDPVIKIAVAATERSKSIKVFEKTIEEVSKKTKMHKPVIIAFGGGVVGDLAGFIASTYRRGVPLIQVPTTLLAQVDSSIGGKVGIDLPSAKNLVGAFYQPKTVLMDPDLLKTLPKKQIKNGLAEVIKYGIIEKKSLFTYIEKNIKGILALENEPMERIIYECASIKARVVEKDEYDVKDIRIILNFGHTLGHAIEAAGAYSKVYNHGESVALGMILASEVAFHLDMMKKNDLDRIVNLMTRAALPTKIKGLTLKDIMSSYVYDKKFIQGTNRFVLPKEIGSVEVVEDIPVLLIKTVLKKYIQK